MTETDYRQSHLQQGKGENYHSVFFRNPYRNMVWQFEQRILDRIVKSLEGRSRASHLDFACGTGRVLHHLAGRMTEQVGVDVSESMLEVARRENPNAEIVEADLTRDDVLGQKTFDLITAFRFFPNAQPDLRMQVMRVIERHLAENGLLVFNDHKNTGSTRNRLARLFGHRDFKGMSIAEVRTMVEEFGLEIVDMYPLCIFPGSESRPLLPIPLLRPVEALLSKLPPLRSLGENLIFVCRRSGGAAQRPVA